MGYKIEIDLSDANNIEDLTGLETLPADSFEGKPIKLSINQILNFIKNSPISSFRMKTSGPNQDEVLITLTDDYTFQFTKI